MIYVDAVWFLQFFNKGDGYWTRVCEESMCNLFSIASRHGVRVGGDDTAPVAMPMAPASTWVFRQSLKTFFPPNPVHQDGWLWFEPGVADMPRHAGNVR